MTKERFIEIAKEYHLGAETIEEAWEARPPEVATMPEETIIFWLRVVLYAYSVRQAYARAERN